MPFAMYQAVFKEVSKLILRLFWFFLSTLGNLLKTFVAHFSKSEDEEKSRDVLGPIFPPGLHKYDVIDSFDCQRLAWKISKWLKRD